MGFNDVTPKVANSVALALNSPRKKKTPTGLAIGRVSDEKEK